MLIAVSGNIGSGKTTLAKFLARQYGFHYIPQRRLEFGFINDFFHDIEGKFFPAQVSFLLSKAIEIQEIDAQGENLVVDRSLLEDANVFARLWIENRNIDAKIAELYKVTYDFITKSIPAPDLYIVCKCPPEVCTKRISQRPKRSFENEYPPNHISRLAEYYEDIAYGDDVPRVEIDTVQYDFSNLKILEQVCNQVFEHMRNHTHYNQLSLFEEFVETTDNTSGIRFYNFEYFAPRTMLINSSRKARDYIYLAAPFTQFATEKATANAENDSVHNLFSALKGEAYGALPTHYRSQLNKIRRAIEEASGLPVLLPHKDINDWGNTSYPAEYITPKIIEGVTNATALVAIPGNSVGVHLELGMAITKGIPAIILDTQDLPSSFFVKGFRSLPNVMYIQMKSFSSIPSYIASNRISDFIFNNVTTSRGKSV